MNAKQIQGILAEATGHHRAGRLEQAANLYRKVLSTSPNNADALHLIGLIAYQQGDHQGAMRLISRAISLTPREASYHFHLGVVQAAAGLLDQARAAYGKAILIRPDYPEAHNNLGLILAGQGRNKEAKGCYETALQLRTNFIDALLNLGNLHKNQGELDRAFDCYQRVLVLNPDNAGAYNNLGNLMLRRGKLEDAVEYYRRSLSLNPNDVDPTNNLGGALMRLGLHDEALRYFDQAIRLAPDHAGTHLNRAWLLLLRGEYGAGWKEYEWRLRFEESAGAVFRWLTSRNCPAWDGSSPAGRTILVHCEQGLGDTIHFVRYLPLLRSLGARIVFCCQRELIPLMASTPGIDVLLTEPVDGQVTEAFDYHIPLLSLPGLLDPGLSRLPSKFPYLLPGPEPVKEWESKLKHAGFKVGIVWAGRPSNKEDWRRSCRLADFSSLTGVAGAVFFSLQKGPAASEAQAPPSGMNLVDISTALRNFEDTAAAIMNLDLVIAVDTAVAHLAGALARPVWTLLPAFPDWRWLLGREDTRWYPTMRLFRQPQSGDWNSVFETVAAELSRNDLQKNPFRMV